MFKRTWQVVFWGARNVFGAPKQFAEIVPSEVGKVSIKKIGKYSI